MHGSILSFWESIAAAILQPEAPLHTYIADRLDAHQKGEHFRRICAHAARVPSMPYLACR